MFFRIPWVVALGLQVSFAQAAQVIVSDVDDTVKITHVENPFAALGNGLFSDKVYGGMARLYAELSGSAAEGFPSPSLYFLSGSPDGLLNSRVVRTLEGSGFPTFSLTLKSWRKWGASTEGTRAFKKSELEKIAARTGAALILVGDDTELDPEAYTEFLREHPAVNGLATYIHRVARKDRPLPAGAQAYFTAFDIAVRERAAGRLSADQARAVGETVLGSADDLLIHDDGRCPREGEAGWVSAIEAGELADVQARVAARIRAICDRRYGAWPARYSRPR